MAQRRLPPLSVQFHESMRAWIFNAHQQLINEKNERPHGVKTEPSGQLRWTQGNFESIKDP